MSNWFVVPQVETRKGESFDVDCKLMRWRPANANEQAQGDEFKPMRATFCVKFSHRMDHTNVFKITAQYRQGEWRYNLHEPDRVVAKEVRSNSVTSVTRETEGTRVVKESTGGKVEHIFRRVFTERVRDAEFVETVMGLFAARMPKEKAASEAA